MKTADNKANIQSALIWGPWQKEIRETFGKAKPVLKRLPPKVDRRFLLYLLREQTWIAMKWPNPDQRAIEQAWMALCHALEKFLSTAFGTGTVHKIKRAFQGAKIAAKKEGRKLELWVRPQDLAPKPSEEILKGLEIYAQKLGLPRYEEVVEGSRGGKPTSWWSDAVALAMKKHFEKTTRSPQWRIVSKLLACAPAMQYAGAKAPHNQQPVSMQPEEIRQRLVRWQREDRAPVQYQPTVSQMAYELERLYDQWIKAGADRPCPSLVQPSGFRALAFDTSLSV
ncbi:hypothetical protein EPO44_06330 [bacterium]|nr:MAG: hypothetical protein EPO44_06330 [bacterium]